MINQLNLYFNLLSIEHMGGTYCHCLDHNQIKCNIYCTVMYHHKVVDWRYQCWPLYSWWTSCIILLNDLMWSHDIQYLPLTICIRNFLKIVGCRIQTIDQLHWMGQSTNVTGSILTFHHKSSTTETMRYTCTKFYLVYNSWLLHKRFVLVG